MAKPPGPIVVKWRDLAADGKTYAEIHRRYPEYTEDQIRHYCVGSAGRRLPGPLQRPGRWKGRNAWLQGENSPNSELSEVQVRAVLDDWDDEKGDWGTPGTVWAERLGVSTSTIYMLRRGETWEYLEHPNQGRSGRKKRE